MKLLIAALFAVMIAMTAQVPTANAGYKHYYLCWKTTAGTTTCERMPRNYRVPGVPKPTPAADGVQFRLTRMIIACLRGVIDTSDMRPAQYAWIYTPKTGL